MRGVVCCEVRMTYQECAAREAMMWAEYVRVRGYTAYLNNVLRLFFFLSFFFLSSSAARGTGQEGGKEGADNVHRAHTPSTAQLLQTRHAACTNSSDSFITNFLPICTGC